MTVDLQEVKSRFLRRFVAGAKDSCWLWMGTRLKSKWDYGILTVHGTAYRAHRLSFQFFIGSIPEGLAVLHACDVPACVNPGHLFLGTNADNIRDAVCKGRMNVNRPRDGQPATKITESQIADIIALWASGITGRQIASQFCVDPSTISLILRNRGYHKWRKKRKECVYA
jgi:hypothetical protein